MMAARLLLAPLAAAAILASYAPAGAQAYPPDETNQDYAPPPGTGQVPAAYDPYGAAGGTYGAPAQGNYAPPPGVRDPYAQQQPQGGAYPPGQVGNAQGGYAAQPGYQQPAYQEPPVAAVPAPSNPYGQQQAPAQAAAPMAPHAQPGYPAGAYSGQPPAGMASPYGQSYNQPAPGYPAQQQAGYPAPAITGTVPGGAPPGAVGGSSQPGSSQAMGANGSSVAMLPDEDQPETGPIKELPANLKRQVVDYVTKEAPGTIVIDTPNTYLYYVLPGGKAERYGIGVGRDGFTWAGTQKISRKAEWPDWRPPEEMIERQPYLPRFMAGGPGNPMGARAMYLGGTIYRIHGTNQPSTIGQFMSSGCIRMLNEDVESLYEKAKVGTKVVVLPGNTPPKTAAAPDAAPAPVSVR